MQEDGRLNRREIVVPRVLAGACILAVAAAGLALRCHALDRRPMASDEAFSWRAASMPAGELMRAVSLDTHPPLHFLLESGWIAAFGDSLFVLRLLSAMAGAAVIPVIFLLVASYGPNSRSVGLSIGAMAAAVLSAGHAFQLEQSRAARMYSLGMLLAAVSTWLLLRILFGTQSPRPRTASADRVGERAFGAAGPGLWAVYGVATGLFLLCHHFAVFTVVAHGVFVVCWAVRLAIAGDRRMADLLIRNLSLAAAVSAAVYSFWIPSAVAQLHRVDRDFWVPGLTVSDTLAVAMHWATGSNAIGDTGGWFAPIVIAVLLANGAFLGGAAGRLFALMTVVPWGCVIALSTLGNRPLVQERYFAFAHVGLVCLIGAGINAFRWLPAKILAAAAALTVCLPGSVFYLAGPPRDANALRDTAEYVAKHYRPGDVVLTLRPHTLLCMQYYFARIGRDDIDIKVPLEVSQRGGHVNHVAALREGEMIVSDDFHELRNAERIWKVSEPGSEAATMPKEWRLTATAPFRGAMANGTSEYTLGLYRRLRQESSEHP